VKGADAPAGTWSSEALAVDATNHLGTTRCAPGHVLEKFSRRYYVAGTVAPGRDSYFWIMDASMTS
jgi:hypothetical protein